MQTAPGGEPQIALFQIQSGDEIGRVELTGMQKNMLRRVTVPNVQAVFGADVQRVVVQQKTLYAAIDGLLTRAFQFFGYLVDMPQSGAVAHEYAFSGQLDNGVHALLHFIDADDRILLYVHPVETVERIAHAEPYPPLRIFVNGIDQQVGQSVGEGYVAEYTGIAMAETV